MKWLVVSVFAVIPALVILTGCSSSTNDGNAPNGYLRLRINTGQALSPAATRSIDKIDRLHTTISGAGMTPVVSDLPFDPQAPAMDETMTVPAGANRTIRVEAMGGETILYSGTATVKIMSGQVVAADVILRPVSGEVAIDITVHEGEPTLAFTYIPAIGSTDSLAGIVSGDIDPTTLAVAVYIRVGSGWWTKPYFSRPKVSPDADGKWSCPIVTGGADASATAIAAYLVPEDAEVPQTSGGALPYITGAQDFIKVERTQQ